MRLFHFVFQHIQSFPDVLAGLADMTDNNTIRLMFEMRALIVFIFILVSRLSRWRSPAQILKVFLALRLRPRLDKNQRRSAFALMR